MTGDDPVQAVYTLKDYIVHTHAKDGRMLRKTDPRVIYDFFAEGGIGIFGWTSTLKKCRWDRAAWILTAT